MGTDSVKYGIYLHPNQNLKHRLFTGRLQFTFCLVITDVILVSCECIHYHHVSAELIPCPIAEISSNIDYVSRLPMLFCDFFSKSVAAIFHQRSEPVVSWLTVPWPDGCSTGHSCERLLD